MESGENEAPEMNPGRIERPATEPNKTFGEMFGETFGAATEISDPGYRKSGYETPAQADKVPLWPGSLSPISTRGYQATSLGLRIRHYQHNPTPSSDPATSLLFSFLLKSYLQARTKKTQVVPAYN
jgi:hypothetical protein